MRDIDCQNKMGLIKVDSTYCGYNLLRYDTE